MPKKKNDFEKSLNRVEEISGSLENEEMKLEDALELYKEAMKLITKCQNQIDEAEREIYIYREKAQDNQNNDNNNVDENK
ncbi:MAG: exodeoxyribonuclease VII small subunit, partial [bacterium]